MINWETVVKKYSNKAKLEDHSNMKRILQATGIDWISSESGLQLSLGPRFANFNITN
jgi:hypothetical protein